MNTNAEIQKSSRKRGGSEAIAAVGDNPIKLMPTPEHSDGAANVDIGPNLKPAMPAIGNPYALAKVLLVENNGDRDAAIAGMIEMMADPAIRAVMSGALIAEASASYVAKAESNTRAMIERHAMANAGVMNRAASVDVAFMNWPLPFGGLLKDATRDDIERSAQHYEASASTARRRAAWLRSIAEKLPDGGVSVSMALTEADLHAAWEAGQ